jgi:phage terminase large subunit
MEIKAKVDSEFKFLYERHRFKASYGGRGGKKSWGYAQAILILSCKYRLRVLCCREVQKSIKDSVKKLLEDWIVRMGLSSQFIITNTEIKHVSTGAEILFSGLQDHTSDSIKSYESIDICWVEEAHSISQKSLDILLPTIRKNRSEVWFTWNPNLPNDPIDVMFRGSITPKSSVVKEFSYKDNKYLPQEFIDGAELLKKTDYERYCHVYLGHYKAQDDNQLISYNLIEKSIASTPDHLDVPIIAGLDPAREGADRTALVIRQGFKILFWKTWPKTDDYFPLASEVADLCRQYEIEMINVDIVGVGEGLPDILKRVLGGATKICLFRGGNKPRSNVYTNKRSETWHLAKKWLDEGGKIPDSNVWIEDLVLIRYFYKDNSQKGLVSKEKLKSKGGKSPDIGDAWAMTFDENLLFQSNQKQYTPTEHEWNA